MPYQSISTRNKSRGIKGKFKKKDEPLNSSNNDTDQLSNSLSSRIFSTAKSSQHQHQQHNYCKDPISSFVQEECVLIAEDKDCDWQSGRRVVELGMLAEGLRSCECCPNPLYLHNTVNIRSVGLASVLDVQCSSCGRINNVHSGKKHGKIYDMNTKLALALLHSGVGLAQINSILSSLNIPAVHHTMIMRRQNEAGLAVELTAKESSEKYLNEEVKLSEEAEDLAVFQTAVSSTFVFGSPEPKAQR